ncbi:pantetheine-phosphate adenylyltransferase [Agrilactobacillus fermenti]|uniref:pantetheine-phosphate adenylyltransferase n=1 Tax=Agrilactobacillus fermenti TaxID=2586909 RepID=UPI001E2D8EB9|nr:pantetheine-phosphate adenylyltransferase [Agrilactobacillus fermenti]MCD2255262.1 pantetheine-phosphate adenylyltransferase [Agrilactobacillus fermenti]
MTEKIGLFPGSFDPFTNGHLATVKKALTFFDKVYIAVATNTGKSALFSTEEKVALIKDAVTALESVTVIAAPRKLTVTLARELGATTLIRGLRNGNDFEYEAGIAQMNKVQDASIETVFFMADQEYNFISSSMIKEVAAFNGRVTGLVPKNVEIALKQKLQEVHYGN